MEGLQTPRTSRLTLKSFKQTVQGPCGDISKTMSRHIQGQNTFMFPLELLIKTTQGPCGDISPTMSKHFHGHVETFPNTCKDNCSL